MSTPVRAIVGLGNPGPDYALTRHNAGALWVQYLAEKYGQPLRQEKRFHGWYTKLPLPKGDLHLLFPSTFMNRSGQAVIALSQFFKIDPENILVAYDELDLNPGTLRLKMGGGHGGHNGIKDIIRVYGGNRDFPRLRFGIGHPGDKSKVVNYVLGRLGSDDMNLLEDSFRDLDGYLGNIMSGDWSTAMNHLHRTEK
ncbi:aminoacyl-tRNA hydrolase [Hahella sp. CCB-MM4]|uniref:aminoacyl-tRNA hydrolase n=1 Tax=Hahella sp. (strain CCB-MM4) TaxID=1926491 RepID=UPI000B9C6079|nr:aminoacyl-tRNA hydrolase [Hahella sp. CCB-MM4]OZG70683.1 aminoacyl-tRNA hydrolase [Hahella sp. CCB-MM4]